MILLSVWMWEHFSIGRPKLRKYKDWEDHCNPLRMPTWAYMWDVVGEFKGDPQLAYTQYVNEFDTLTADQVIMSCIIIHFLFYELSTHLM